MIALLFCLGLVAVFLILGVFGAAFVAKNILWRIIREGFTHPARKE